jgi:hypothetical protein
MDGAEHDDLDSGWDAADAETDPSDEPGESSEAVDAAWDDLPGPAAPGKRRPSRKRRERSATPLPASAPVVRPAPAATPSAKRIRRRLEREARAKAAAAKAERKAEERARRASGRRDLPEAKPAFESPAAKSKKPRPVVARAPVRAKPETVERAPGVAAKRAKKPVPKRAHAAAKKRPRPKLSTSSPIVLVALFMLVAGVVIYFASR